MNVVIRTDSSAQIGTGHLTRCLTLADELHSRGIVCHFICRDLPGHIGSLVADKGYKLHLLPAPTDPRPAGMVDESAHADWLGVSWQRDMEETRATLAGLGAKPSWLIVDHYALDAKWELAVRPQVGQILVIDDLADRAHACDALLDQNLHESPEERYAGRLPVGCQRFLGPQYALLRPEFSAARKALRVRDGSVRRILVFFGGVDSRNETGKTLEAISLLDFPDVTIDVAIGISNPHWRQIEDKCRQMGAPARLYRGATNMAELMATADLAVGGGGVTTWERLSVGLPALAWAIARNQVPGLAMLARQGAIISPDAQTVVDGMGVARHLYALLHNPALCRFVSERAMALCDGRGTGRVVSGLFQRPLRLRRAQQMDCDPVFSWRNHPDVRRNALDPSPIPYERHKNWFNDSLDRTDRILLIAEQDGSAVGVLRFDFNGVTAEVSIYLVPDKMGLGLGETVLRAGEDWMRQENLAVDILVARILKTNSASKALFERVGFREQYGFYTKRPGPINRSSRSLG